MTSARGISFDIRPSGVLTRRLAAIVALASVAPLFTGLPWVLRALLAGGIALHGVFRLLAFRDGSPLPFTWAADGVWTVTLPDGRETVATLVYARIFGGAVFLHLRWPGGAGRFGLLGDNAPEDSLRLLRARLASQGRARP